MGMDSPQPTPSRAAREEKHEEKATTLARGTLIADRYKVVDRLGEGGMGVVYSVEHTHMRKLFALKVLHRELLRMPEAVSRFEREAVLAGSINHANVAAATDFGKLPDGSFFLILELVIGKGLRALIAEGPCDAVRALPIMRGMTAGVAAAHAKGIVHRDLKPDNVMLVERDGAPDFVKVLDFGIAKGDAMPDTEPASAQKSGQPLTRIGTIMGTPDYMSPEQALGQPVDLRSDLYSLGIIFFELLTGAPPFQGEGIQVLRQHLMEEAPPIPPERVASVTLPLAAIVKRLLAKEPERRFQTAADLLAALDGMPARTPPAAEVKPKAGADPSSNLDAKAEAITDPELHTRPTPRGKSIVVGLGSLGFLVLAVVLAFVLFSSRTPAALTEADAAAAPTGSVSAEAQVDRAPPISPSASASADPIEAEGEPSASPATSEAAPAPARRGRGRRTPAGQPAPRRTGPGGIYIPPPRDWFK